MQDREREIPHDVGNSNRSQRMEMEMEINFDIILCIDKTLYVHTK